MNKLLLYCTLPLLACLCACGSDNEPDMPEPTPGGSGEGGKEVTVSITTDILTKADPILSFSDGDKMAVFAKTYGRVDAPNIVEDVVGLYKNGAWTLEPPITLSEGGKAFIYAYYPYMEGQSNLAALPIETAKQQDVLYSGAFVPVTYTTHRAKLTMKHALSLVSMNITAQGYSGKGELQSLSIGGEDVYSKGTLNVSTGKIAGTEKGSTELKNIGKKITTSGWKDELPRIWQIPFSTKIKIVTLGAVIDGKQYQCNFPEVEMKSGFQYIFRLVLTDYGLEFIPTQTTTISLNQDGDEPETLEGYGLLKIYHEKKAFQTPFMLGDNVFGTIKWGDDFSDSYTFDKEHDYTISGKKEVILETWNSIGFELENINGINAIDITDY